MTSLTVRLKEFKSEYVYTKKKASLSVEAKQATTLNSFYSAIVS